MRKIASVVFGILVLVMVASCATNHEVALSQNKNIVGKNGIKRPDWVLQDQSNMINHYAAGYGVGKTFETSMMKAKLNADAALALWVSNSVEAVRDRYIEETNDNGKETYIDKFVSSANEAGKAVLSGITEIDFWEDLEGGIWVLHMIPVANIKAQIESAIDTVCADKTLFSDEAKSKEVFEKLNKALDAYFPEK